MNKQPVYYMQTDPKWKNLPYKTKGENSTIGGSGCGPTSAAMLIETLTGKTFTPVDACNWSMQHGFKALGQGTFYGYFEPQFAAYGIDCKMMNYSNSYGNPNHANHKRAFDLLKQGYYIIACMGKGNWTSSGHFIVVWWEDGKVRINDPASTKPARLSGDLNTFKSQVKYYWYIDARKHNNGGSFRPEVAPQTKSVDYKVEVYSADKELNCRADTSTKSAIVKVFKNSDVLHITKEQGSWGYCGDGWVWLDYTKKYNEEEEDMTQEKFNEMMNKYLEQRNNMSEPDWSKKEGAWANATDKGIVNGKAPQGLITRDEVVVILSRLGLFK